MFLWHKFATSIYKESIYFYVQRTLQNKFLYIFHFSNSKKNLYGNTKITDLQKRLVCCLFVSCSCYCENWWKLDDHKQQHPGVYTYSDVSSVIRFLVLLPSNMRIESRSHFAFNINSMYFLKYIIARKRIALSEMEMCKALHVSHKRIEKSKTCSHVVTARLHHRKSGADFCILRWSTTSYLQYICIPFVFVAIIPSISLQH